MKPEYLNARQVYEIYGISRNALGQLAEAGKVVVRHLQREGLNLKLYYVADLERIINGGDDGEL